MLAQPAESAEPAQPAESAQSDRPSLAHTTRATSADHFDDLYSRLPPWEIGRPQPAFTALAEAGAFRGRVLDIGCGTGEHTLLAAGLGLDATGIDFSETALDIAREKARQRGLTARFRHHDALRLGDLDGRFDTAIDSLLFHAFDASGRAAYLNGLRSVLRPGGCFFMLGFSDLHDREPAVPHSLSRRDIESSFADGWRLDSLEPALAANRHPDGVVAWLAAATRLQQGDPEMPASQALVPTTRAGRYLTQLCDHGSRMSRHTSHATAASHTEDDGTIEFGWGRCTLQATGEALVLRAEAADPESLRRVEEGVARRLEQIGRRDGLSVRWEPA